MPRLIRCNRCQSLASFDLNGFEWAKPLSMEQHKERELLLLESEYSRKRGTRWALIADDAPEDTTDLLSSCESYKREAVLGFGNGQVTMTHSYRISYVFTPKVYRGKGYASTLMTLLMEELKKDEESLGSHLYSDVGADFYCRIGWKAYHRPTTTINVKSVTPPAPSTDNCSQLSDMTLDTLPAILCNDTKRLYEYAKSSAHPIFIVLPTPEHAISQHIRSRYCARALRNIELPPILGKSIPNTDSFIMWFIAWNENKMFVTRFRCDYVENAKLLLAAVVDVAITYGLEKVEIWDLEDRFVGIEIQEGVKWDRFERSACIALLAYWGLPGDTELEWHCNESDLPAGYPPLPPFAASATAHNQEINTALPKQRRALDTMADRKIVDQQLLFPRVFLTEKPRSRDIQFETLHSRQHRQVPTMSRLSKIHMVIVIIVFLVLHIRAADDSEKMKKLAATMVTWRITAAGKTKVAQNNHDVEYLANQMKRLSSTIKARENYVPVGITLRREDLLQDPSPEDSREKQEFEMEFNAYQYEACQAIRFKIVNALGPNVLPPNARRSKSNTIQHHSKKLANLMQCHLSLEVKYGVALDVVAPHLRTVLTQYGETSHGRDPQIKGLRRRRNIVDQLIGRMRNNLIRVSTDNAMDESVLGWFLWSIPEECTMEPNSDMTDLQLHRVMEYNALWSEMCGYKSEQLKVVLNYESPLPKIREMLQCRQKEILEQRRTCFATACKYAQELIERPVYASLPLDGKRPPFDVKVKSGEGNEVHISEGNVQGASSEWVELNCDLEDRNMLSQLLEESRGPSLPFQESLVDNQAPTVPYHVEPCQPINQGFTYNQNFVYQSSPGVEAYGSEEIPPHGITPGHQFPSNELFGSYRNPVDEYWSQSNRYCAPNEANVMPSLPLYHHIAHADEAGSSNEPQYCFDRHGWGYYI
ncbi:hypothetical protein SeLEV6574_g00769 [Synchytrium endobioticum]|uniref:LYC1 C-terminal domain-containing protein n=1 Tax=Synchytrium endobioticum TaxID=286115 RepID=A0A507DG87_9FUNG|nr:hypothetical protein SeLEV6574_g00769 [Synchytrium endobioticum]